MAIIRELAQSAGFKGTSSHKIAEPAIQRNLPVIDNSVPTLSNVTTSVDCYVSGQYVLKKGQVLEVTQRYSIFISYCADTQDDTVRDLKNMVLNLFEDKYGSTFNVTTVFVPSLPIPEPKLPGVGPGQSAPLEMYEGSGMFKNMTAYQKYVDEIKSQKAINKYNLARINERYGYSKLNERYRKQNNVNASKEKLKRYYDLIDRGNNNV